MEMERPDDGERGGKDEEDGGTEREGARERSDVGILGHTHAHTLGCGGTGSGSGQIHDGSQARPDPLWAPAADTLGPADLTFPGMFRM